MASSAMHSIVGSEETDSSFIRATVDDHVKVKNISESMDFEEIESVMWRKVRLFVHL
jgi:hypothetical protein